MVSLTTLLKPSTLSWHMSLSLLVFVEFMKHNLKLYMYFKLSFHIKIKSPCAYAVYCCISNQYGSCNLSCPNMDASSHVRHNHHPLSVSVQDTEHAGNGVQLANNQRNQFSSPSFPYSSIMMPLQRPLWKLVTYIFSLLFITRSLEKFVHPETHIIIISYDLSKEAGTYNLNHWNEALNLAETLHIDKQRDEMVLFQRGLDKGYIA